MIKLLLLTTGAFLLGFCAAAMLTMSREERRNDCRRRYRELREQIRKATTLDELKSKL